MSQVFGEKWGDEDWRVETKNKIDSAIRTELERHLNNVARDLKTHLINGDLNKVLEDAIDVILYVSYPSRQPVGFDIGITTGGPNINLVYDRGVCELRGSWSGVTATKYVDNEICETIMLDYFLS